MAPWTADDMARKGARKPEQAARIANAVLASCLASAETEQQRKKCEGLAIATSLARTQGKQMKGK